MKTTLDKTLLKKFKRYSSRLRRNGKFFKEDTPIEDRYVQDYQLRKKLNSDDILDLIKTTLFYLTPSILFLWIIFYSEKTLINQFGKYSAFKYIVPFGLIFASFYAIVYVPLQIIRKARSKKTFCSRCGKQLRLVSLLSGTCYICDSCERWTGVVNLDLDGPP